MPRERNRTEDYGLDDGIPVAQYTFKRSDQVTTLQSKSSVRVDGQPIHIDPELLFQRLIVASRYNAIDDRKASFRFGSLWRHTHAESTTESRSGERYLDRLPPDIAGPTGEVKHVFDGGSLLHRITWVPNISTDMRPLL